MISERGEQIFNQRLFCLGCGIGYEPLDPRLFSFNSQQGACSECAGMGFTWDFDPDLIFADPRQPLRRRHRRHLAGIFGERLGDRARAAKTSARSQKTTHGVDIDKPFAKLPKKTQEEILYGGSGRKALSSAWCRF